MIKEPFGIEMGSRQPKVQVRDVMQKEKEIIENLGSMAIVFETEITAITACAQEEVLSE